MGNPQKFTVNFGANKEPPSTAPDGHRKPDLETMAVFIRTKNQGGVTKGYITYI